MRAGEANETQQSAHQPVSPGAVPTASQHDAGQEGFGQRLCAARERQGLSQADVASRLKLPLKLVARLEADDYAGLTEGVFLQGYLASYARLVGVPVEDATRVAASHTQVAPLVATGTISRSRYLFDRYSVSATYLILTAIIVVPAVWLATHGGLEQNLARTALLDPPASVADGSRTVALPTPEGTSSADGRFVPSPPAPPTPSQPVVIASMTPFPSAPDVEQAERAPLAAPAAAGAGAHTLRLRLAERSWVEIIDEAGRRLEYAMLPAGSEHAYHSNGPLSVRLGNASGAQLHGDGNAIDLAPYQRGNVAQVTLFGASGPTGAEPGERQ
jgi:cytoskeleton protein RodZ